MLNVKKLIFCFLLWPIFCFSADFETLMGKGTNQWEFVETPEDQKRLSFFKEAFNKNFSKFLASDKTLPAKIPKVFHIIWLGPKEFPDASLRKIEKWVELHPEWTFKFWTDIDRNPPMELMKKQLIEDFSFQFLLDAYDQSDNFGEKAKILSYEILFQEGGVYIDHDVKTCKSLDEFNAALDFYCGLEKLGPSILSSSIFSLAWRTATVTFCVMEPARRATENCSRRTTIAVPSIATAIKTSSRVNPWLWKVRYRERTPLWLCGLFCNGYHSC